MEVLTTEHLVTQLVILGFLLRIAQDLVGRIDLFELVLRLWILVDIRMVFSCELSVCFFNFVSTRILTDA